jgi:hypothetical protein
VAEPLLSPEEPRRKRLAVGLCLLSTALAMIDWHFGERPWLVLGFLAGAWSFTADWLQPICAGHSCLAGCGCSPGPTAGPG